MNSTLWYPHLRGCSVSHLRLIELQMIQNGSRLYTIFTRRPAVFLWLSSLSPDKAYLKCFPSSAWVYLCQNPFFLKTLCLCSNTVHFGRLAPCLTNEDSKPTSSADFQAKAYMKEIVKPLQCISLPGSAYEYCFLFLLLLTWALKFSWDLPHLIKSNWSIAYLLSARKVDCTKSLCF